MSWSLSLSGFESGLCSFLLSDKDHESSSLWSSTLISNTRKENIFVYILRKFFLPIIYKTYFFSFFFQIHRPLLLTLVLITICKAAPPVEFLITDQEGRSLGTVDIDPSVAEEDPNLLDASRIKRSGSGGIFGYIKDGISSKLGQIASASAGAAAHFSGSSSGSTGYGYGYGSVSFYFN